MKTKCRITGELQSVRLIYHLYLYKAIYMDALTITILATLLTVDDFHHFS